MEEAICQLGLQGHQIALLLVCDTLETTWYGISFVALAIFYIFNVLMLA